MSSETTNQASQYFNENWKRYRNSIECNTLYHREMFAALNEFIQKNIKHPFSFVDVGCGDSTATAAVLSDKPVSQYIGIDAAKDVLKIAAQTLAPMNCEKEFIAENMNTAIKQLKSPVDIIFTSYAVHHLSPQEKIDFLLDCKKQLKANGFFLMVDVIREDNQTRDAWLDALKARIQLTQKNITADELAFRMQHPSANDYPEKMTTFKKIAQEQGWRFFDVLVNKGIFAFMLFAK